MAADMALLLQESVGV